MFGGAKPTFGSTSAGFGSFNNPAAASPFGQSTTFGKPATSAFGAAPAFGATQQQATPLFGAATAQPQQPTGLFGGANTSTAFGGTTATQPAFGGAFSQPQQNTSIFGAPQPTANTNSLFGQPTTSAFGSAVKPGGLSGFGQAAGTGTTSLFGQPAASMGTSSFGTFGQAATTTTNAFGGAASSAFGQPGAAAGGATAGTSLAKYQPTIGTDTLMKGGQTNNVSTKQHCITAMKEYEAKSLEELRMEDYLVNRKGPQAGTSAGGFFGAGAQQQNPVTGLFGATQQQTTGLFGLPAAGPPENKSIFGSGAFGQPATSAFGAAQQQQQQQNSFLAKPFGQPAQTGFGTTADASANPFGQKPAFGQTAAPSMFGQQPAVSAAPAFGQAQNPGFVGFGTNAGQQQTTMFAQQQVDPNKPAFGLGAVSQANNTGGFAGFGNPATSTAGTGMFGNKPATGFGAGLPAFGATSAANTGFTNFSLNNTGAGLFNTSMNKPATTAFGGFGTQTSAAPLNFNTSTMFSNAGAKPGGIFAGSMGNAPNNAGTGLFGGGTGAFGTSLGNSFGTNTLGGTNMTLGGAAQQQPLPIHQQIMSKVTSPYGDNPIFKDLKRGDETDATRATNPAAQKALLETTNVNGQFKVSAKPSPSAIKIKPVGSTLTKKSLFEGLEESDPSVETFNLKPNAKRLIIKPKANSSIISSGGAGGSQSGTPNTSFAAGNATASSASGTPQRHLNDTSSANLSVNVVALRNESFNAEIAAEPAAQQVSGSITTATTETDASRRESWLHPNNLEKVRQINAGRESVGIPMNNTLSELVPRKPLDTYRTSADARLSVSTVPENPFEDQQVSSLSRREAVTFSDNPNESMLSSSRSYSGAELRYEDGQADCEEHPTGITLRRMGYYTIPTLDDLKSYLAEDGTCIVPNFTVGREGYGNVYFGKEMDVAGLNLDEAVHFRNKQVIIYPDDDNKPPIGTALNREAQVTLDQVWPHDKTLHETIKDPQRLADMGWEAKLRRICDKNDTRFIEYRPETGSWVFGVKHFSKYGLSDSDEDDDIPTDPKKPKMGAAAAAAGDAMAKAAAGDKMTLAALKNAQKISEDAARALDPKALAGGMGSFYDSAEFMLMDKTQFFQNNGNDYSMFDQPLKPVHYDINSPTAALARDSGINAHKLQLMKASLFMDDEDDAKTLNSGIEERARGVDYNRNAFGGGRPQDPYTSVQSLWKDAGATSVHSDNSSQLDYGFNTSPHLPGSSAGSVLSIIREIQTEPSSPAPPHNETTVPMIKQPAKMPPMIIKPKVALVRSQAMQVPFCKSIAFPLRSQWASDLGLYNSRRFKLGFGPQNTLIVPTTRDNSEHDIKNAHLQDAAPRIFKIRAANDFSVALMQHIQISSTQHYADFRESIVDHLGIQLRNSLQEDVKGSECPWIRSDSGSDLIVKHLNEAIKLINLGPLEEYAVSVWSLLLSLWGEHDEMEGHEASSHFVLMCRRNLLSEWLENALTDQDLLTKNVSKHSYLDHMLELIMCHKVTEACELAFKYDDGNMALLLSQLSSGPVVRQLVEDQLAAWHKDQADTFIQLERLKLLMLVAGVSLMNSAHGPINTLEGIDWIKVLAIQLWYLSSPTASITDALFAYEKSFKSEEFYSLPPTPHYMENAAAMEEPNIVYDLRYHLLQLYSKRSHPMEGLLNPVAHTSDPMDFRLSWLVLQTLEAVGYTHCSALSESQLHVGFAAQLESNNLWEWAVFVLLHIKDRNQRELAVQCLLYRYVTVAKDVLLTDKEKFVINNLGVPEKWIDYAKAVKAGALGNHHLQATYLLKAKQWSLAHEIIFQHIAPDAVINDNLEYLHRLLIQFEDAELHKSVKVPNWSNQGQIFLDFIDINEKFKGLKVLKTPADIEARWENLKPQLADLCSRINLLPCPTAKHRLCQSEIAQNLACLVHGVLLVCPVLNPCLIIKIALERLPLPQEFAQQELRALLDTLVSDLTKAYLSKSTMAVKS